LSTAALTVRDGTIARVRQVVLAHGGLLAACSVSYLFTGGRLYLHLEPTLRAERGAVQAGAEDVIPTGRQPSLEVLTDPIDFETVRVALRPQDRPDQRASDLPRSIVPLEGRRRTMLH